MSCLLGIEEEVFITDPLSPSMQSLFYLSRLLWSNPAYFYRHSASNFARGRDIRHGLMSAVEISTRAHADVEQLLADLARRRQELSRASDGLLVPAGHLFDRATPSNTAGMHVHLGPFAEPRRVYHNLVHFLPLLSLLTVSSPLAAGRPQGLSYRMQQSFALGPLRSDWQYRFQDIIWSKRLGTLEIRIFDPVWDLDRLRRLLFILQRICASEQDFDGNRQEYNRLRLLAATVGYEVQLQKLHSQLEGLVHIPQRYFDRTIAHQLLDSYRQGGCSAAYTALDCAYRQGDYRSQPLPVVRPQAWKILVGWLGYYLPRLPYVIWKVRREW